ncbi:hypothetical protein B0H19DRAFT_1058515 [Mycena capillaripes]|nr:hypothetical protein B0H19DRAFT_1058515 [Mycena capillaripes]
MIKIAINPALICTAASQLAIVPYLCNTIGLPACYGLPTPRIACVGLLKLMCTTALTSPRASWVRKIPGTTYSQPRPASDHASAATHSASSLNGWEQESAGDGSADPDVQSHDGASFGQEQHTSREARGACVPVLDQEQPFFQTKLSTSPSIIAFVRLEMCSAAGEIIEGGWCTRPSSMTGKLTERKVDFDRFRGVFNLPSPTYCLTIFILQAMKINLWPTDCYLKFG